MIDQTQDDLRNVTVMAISKPEYEAYKNNTQIILDLQPVGMEGKSIDDLV